MSRMSKRGGLRALLFAAAMLSWVPGQASALTISLEPLGSAAGTDTIQLGAGDTARIAVVVRDVPSPGLAAFQFEVQVDPSLISLSDPNDGSPFDMFVPLGGEAFCALVRGEATCPDPDWFLTATGRTEFLADAGIDNASGVLRMAYGSFGANGPPIGNGVLALFDITLLSDAAAQVAFGEVILSDDGEPPAAYDIQTAGLAVVIPEPGTGTLAALGLVLLAGVSRRRG